MNRALGPILVGVCTLGITTSLQAEFFTLGSSAGPGVLDIRVLTANGNQAGFASVRVRSHGLGTGIHSVVQADYRGEAVVIVDAAPTAYTVTATGADGSRGWVRALAQPGRTVPVDIELNGYVWWSDWSDYIYRGHRFHHFMERSDQRLGTMRPHDRGSHSVYRHAAPGSSWAGGRGFAGRPGGGMRPGVGPAPVMRPKPVIRPMMPMMPHPMTPGIVP